MSTSTDKLNRKELLLAVRQLSRLVQVSVTLNSTLDPARLLRYIIQTAAELLDCEAASILLYDEKHNRLLFTASSGLDPEKLARIPVPIDGSIAGTIFRENRPLVINDVEQDPRHYSQVAAQIQFHPRALLGVPMRIQDRVTGVLEAVNKRGGDFNDADASLLSIIAAQAAVAIHNARLVEALQHAYDELNRVDKLKTDFLAIASHELRTPLGMILGYATFLKDEAEGELSDHADRVMNAAIRLRALVEDMTNMNLLRLGTTKLDLTRVSIQSIVKTIYIDVAPTAKAKGQALTIQLPADNLIILADVEKLGLVFTNLLNNAIRFTPDKGEISVTAMGKGGEAWISITDNGAGIPRNELSNIFQDFYQLEDHLIRRHGGLGLGLSIARGLVELHEGRIWAESEGVGKGATFTVALPLVG